MRYPARAGPTSCPALNMVVNRATPLARSFCSTRLDTVAALAGIPRAKPTPCSRVRANTCWMVTRSATMRSARASTTVRLNNSLTMSTSLRFTRSAMTPPNAENTSMGTMPTALTAVTMKEESVSSRASHPRAIIVMKKDVMEMREAAQKMRNWGYAKARRGPRRRAGLAPLAGVWSVSVLMGVLS